MTDKKMNKAGYEAPRIEAASFRTENGYAASEPVMSSTTKITMQGSGL